MIYNDENNDGVEVKKILISEIAAIVELNTKKELEKTKKEIQKSMRQQKELREEVRMNNALALFTLSLVTDVRGANVTKMSERVGWDYLPEALYISPAVDDIVRNGPTGSNLNDFFWGKIATQGSIAMDVGVVAGMLSNGGALAGKWFFKWPTALKIGQNYAHVGGKYLHQLFGGKTYDEVIGKSPSYLEKGRERQDRGKFDVNKENLAYWIIEEYASEADRIYNYTNEETRKEAEEYLKKVVFPQQNRIAKELGLDVNEYRKEVWNSLVEIVREDPNLITNENLRKDLLSSSIELTLSYSVDDETYQSEMDKISRLIYSNGNVSGYSGPTGQNGPFDFSGFLPNSNSEFKGIEINNFAKNIDPIHEEAMRQWDERQKELEKKSQTSFGQQAAAFTRVFQDQMRSVFGDEATTMITNFTAVWAEQNGSWSEMWDENWAGMLSTGLLALDAIDGKQSKIVQGLAGGLGQLQALKAEAKMDWGNLFKHKGGEVTGIAISALGGMFGRDSQVGNALSGVGSGVMMGASFGPMGAFAGGLLGGLSSLMSFDSGPTPEEIAKEYAGKAGGRYGIDSALLEQVILKNSNNGENAWEAMYHPETLQVILSQLKEFGEKTQKMFAEDIAHGINITWVDEQHTSSEDWAAIDNSCMHTQILGAA
jgi:hypothetical protein